MDIVDLSYEEEFAYWLNAYNFLTIKGVLKQLDKNQNWKGNLSWFSKVKFFYLQKFKLRSGKINLYNLENKILRKKFKDPRIHFAINCASDSCPYLPGGIFKASNLEEYLETLTYNFVNNEIHVKFLKDEGKLLLNPIFKWYKQDFKIHGGIITFINKYMKEKIPTKSDEIKTEYLKYNWSLNNQ